MKTHLWLQLSTCSSSSSSSSSVRPQWKASSYSAKSPTPVLHLHTRLHSFLSFSAHCHDRGWWKTLLLPLSSRDQFTHDYDKHYRSTCVHMSSVGIVLHSCRPIREGFTRHSVLRWAHLCTWTPPVPVAPTRRVPITPPRLTLWISSSAHSRWKAPFHVPVGLALPISVGVHGSFRTALLVWLKH